MTRKCLICGKEFKTCPYQIKTGHKIKFCSNECRAIAMKQKIVLAGRPFKKGKHSSPETEFKKGHQLQIGKKHWNWKNGIVYERGYCYLYRPKHRRARMGNYVRRAILVAEKTLGRLISLPNLIHHINGIKDDDRPENLYLCADRREHSKIYKLNLKVESNL
jgi:hypothetical protein